MGSRVVVLEDTHPVPAPIVWYVLIPPALDSTQSKINVFMFYRPEMNRGFDYKDLRDISPGKFIALFGGSSGRVTLLHRSGRI